jgi:hypothetical protein
MEGCLAGGRQQRRHNVAGKDRKEMEERGKREWGWIEHSPRFI